ncbi:hypothetical protein SDRG_03331 [Saprolegnia diclina VS20]|uniref:RGS domain-containing protein n=1 Tax=Saprolegnia diclina (strain VS20) TaxID=1156394 RepID=T0S2E5_SAPDV|nr:hypothetical protein SDRG_03331 [Saprolegnia diclina VS20]EQC39123.1 hypothetical protein SDRG_03331 [Saprolegnia diclina VS20]|eukprot:XP_008607184.1 hypothetical protein SDRG_03331 [Saprolegnia diclina VS20]
MAALNSARGKKGINNDALLTKRDITIDDVTTNPIAVGYLLDFCQKNLCAENLNFVMAVDKYKDRCELLNFDDEEDVKKCGAMAATIWKDFLSRNSPNEVSLPSEDRQITIERMDKITKFKGKLFDVAIQDAMKTLQKDTLNRFIKSVQFSELITRLSEAPESFEEYVLTPPTDILIKVATIDSAEYTIDEILADMYLFPEMHAYLQKKFNAENLKCVRAIIVFEELAKTKNMEAIKNKAWSIFRNFVMPSAPYEVSCTNAARKNVMQCLGCPLEKMFDDVKESTIATLKQDLKSFHQSLDRKSIKDALKKAEKAAKGGIMQSITSRFTRK